MQDYITGKQALLLLEITTRQGLHKIVKEHNITVKSMGAGKPNLYLKLDLENYRKKNKKNIKAMKNPQVIKKAKQIKKTISKNIVNNEKNIKDTRKDLNLDQEKDIDLDQDKKQISIKPNYLDLENPLNEIGKMECDRITQLLKKNKTYKDSDRALVLAYSISYQTYIFAVSASTKMDNVTMDDFGNLKVHPYFTISEKSFNNMDKMAKALGIGVKNRVGLDIKEEKEKSFLEVISEKEKF